MNYLEQFKYILCAVFGALLSFFFPLKDFVYAMLILFFVNFVFGVIAGQLHGEEWELRKALVFFVHCTLFFVLMVAIFSTGFFMHSSEESLGIVKVLCSIAFWFYSTNIVRNWRLMLVEGTIMWSIADFIYYILTLKMVEKIPFLSGYLKTTHVDIDSKKGSIE